MRKAVGLLLAISGVGCASVLGLDEYSSAGGNAATASGTEAQGNPGPAGTMAANMTASTTMSSATMSGAPTTSDSSTGSGVVAACGNGVVEPGEICFEVNAALYPTRGLDARYFVFQDCDADGDLDIITSDVGEGGISAFRNDGMGGFPTSVPSAIDCGPGPIASEPIGGGAWVTAVMGCSGRQNNVVPQEGTTCGYEVLGSSVRADPIPAAAQFVILDGFSRALVWWGDSFVTTLGVSPTFPGAAGTQEELGPFSMSDATFVDIEGSPLPELVRADPAANTIGWISNDAGDLAGGGSFGGGVGPTPIDIESADFNADQVADFVTANAGDGTVSVLLGVGNTQYSRQGPDPQIVDEATMPDGVIKAVRTIDIDADGFIDIVALVSDTMGGPGQIAILINSGTGVFPSTPSVVLPTTPFPATMQILDVSGDDALDIVIGNFGDPAEGALTVMLGTP